MNEFKNEIKMKKILNKCRKKKMNIDKERTKKKKNYKKNEIKIIAMK